LKFAPNGTGLGMFASLPLPTTSYGLGGLAFDATGNLYVANSSDGTIHKFGKTGLDLGIFASAGLQSPRGIAFDNNGNLFVANSTFLNAAMDQNVHEFGPNGTDLGVFAALGFRPSSIAFAPAAVPEPRGVFLITLGGGFSATIIRRRYRTPGKIRC